ncbi:hypothetical protein [Macrococcus brunensis]|uniref:hypothetical protein n=1 Tax=Macrococcus brunensis TaxID=198483 RepID=UPI001EF09752|nr:hypothetical protein [Macrococcus brunensis]ULG71975.1 hypothetical protein MGG12_00160 [Macrococcus brunensis]
MKHLFRKIKEEAVIIKQSIEESIEHSRRYKRISTNDLDYLSIIDGEMKPIDVELLELKITLATASKYINKIINKSVDSLYSTNAVSYIHKVDKDEDEPVDLVGNVELYILIDEDRKPLIIWDNITAKFSYHPKFKDIIESHSEITCEPYFSKYGDAEDLINNDLFIQHCVIVDKGSIYDFDFADDRTRKKLLLDKMNITRSIFINDKEVMKYIKGKKPLVLHK